MGKKIHTNRKAGVTEARNLRNLKKKFRKYVLTSNDVNTKLCKLARLTV